MTIVDSVNSDTPGNSGTDGSTNGNEGGGGEPSDSGAPSAWDKLIEQWAQCPADADPASLPAFCATLPAVGERVGGEPATPGRSITTSDVARFAPADTVLSAEPQNVAVVGLPANFLSTARTQTVPGTILGRALTIRFTPISHGFDYGDGERRDSATPGTSWEAAGQPQFTPTDTSHVYRTPGTFTATVTVTYSAEIDLGSGWQPISGTLTGPPSSQDIRVVTARTALVLNTCLERPSAPGC